MEKEKLVEVLFVSYDGYAEDFELVRQGFVTMFDTRAEANKLVHKLNKLAMHDYKRLNFYVEYQKYLKSSVDYFREHEDLDARIEQVMSYTH